MSGNEVLKGEEKGIQYHLLVLIGETTTKIRTNLKDYWKMQMNSFSPQKIIILKNSFSSMNSFSTKLNR